jgi:RNA polymerase sigma-70 factor (ECF subfamily)
LRRLGVAAAQLDDATQDVFVVAYRRLAEFDGRSLRGWLYAIALRVASDYRRGAARRQSLPLPESFPTPAPDPERASELNESVRLLERLLAELDAAKRTVFVLGELEELSAPEIAEALGVNLNTIYARLRAARSEFAAALKRQRARSERRTFLVLPAVPALKLGAAVIGLAGGAWLIGAARAERPDERRAAASTPSAVSAGVKPPKELPLLPAPPPALAAPSVAPTEPTLATARPARAPREYPVPREAAPPSLRAEIALLAEVQRALERSDGMTALGLLERHVTSDRQLAAERAAARIRALCAVGRVDEARRRAVEFVRAYPASVQRPAVEGSCAATNPRDER